MQLQYYVMEDQEVVVEEWMPKHVQYVQKININHVHIKIVDIKNVKQQVVELKIIKHVQLQIAV